MIHFLLLDQQNIMLNYKEKIQNGLLVAQNAVLTLKNQKLLDVGDMNINHSLEKVQNIHLVLFLVNIFKIIKLKN